MQNPIKAWNQCALCEFEGLMEFRHLTGEDYSNPENEAVILAVTCPSCGEKDQLLITWTHYQELSDNERIDADKPDN